MYRTCVSFFLQNYLREVVTFQSHEAQSKEAIFIVCLLHLIIYKVEESWLYNKKGYFSAPIDVIKMLGVMGTQGTSVVARWTSVRHDLVNIHMCILMYPLVFSV
jgi:hypothetical protein